MKKNNIICVAVCLWSIMEIIKNNKINILIIFKLL